MKARVTGRDGKKNRASKYWRGLDICTRKEFIDWANSSLEFKVLFKQWEAKDYKLRFTPVVDRINPAEGYTLGNMQWLTQSENSRKARRTIDRVCY